MHQEIQQTNRTTTVDLIDLSSESAPPPLIVLDSREEDTLADDWNIDDINVTEDDRETPFATAHNTLVIEDSDDEHSDRSTESEDQEDNKRFSTPPPTTLSGSDTKLSGENAGKREADLEIHRPWAADQNTGHIDIDLTEPKATSSPKRSSPETAKRNPTKMEQQTTPKR